VDLVVREEPLAAIEVLARIPCAFEVTCVVAVEEGPDACVLAERPVERPWTKDYDAIPGNHPRDWLRAFDTTHWGLLLARLAEGPEVVGGAVLAHRTPGLEQLEAAGGGDGRGGILWDLRVVPDRRREGIGSALFAAAEEWARARGCSRLTVETQDVNAPACRFYARMGCEMTAATPGAYADLPEETRLLWTKALPPYGAT